MATTTPANASASCKSEIATVAREALYPITADETGAGVTPVDYSYPVGNVLRYGINTTPGTTDMTAAIQAAIDVIYAFGGGEVVIPAGTYGVSAISKVFGAAICVNIRGEGRQATTLQKLAGTSTPVISYTTSVGLVSTNFHFSEFRIVGLSKGHEGIYIQEHARFLFTNLFVRDCSTGVHFASSLFCGFYGCWFNQNDTGFKTTLYVAAPQIYNNAIDFNGGGMVGNSLHGVNLEAAASINFIGTNFELNGTTTDLATGGVTIGLTVDDESGMCNINFINCWLEKNYGMSVEVAAAANLTLCFKGSVIIAAESGNVMNVGGIKSLLLEQLNCVSGADTVTVACQNLIIIGGVINELVDTSTRTTIIDLAQFTGTTEMQVNSILSNGSINATGSLSNQGQSGPFTFMSVFGAVPLIGAWNWDSGQNDQPLGLYANSVHLTDRMHYTTAELEDITNSINTTKKVVGSMVFNTSINAPMYATGALAASTWTGVDPSDGAGLTLTPA